MSNRRRTAIDAPGLPSLAPVLAFLHCRTPAAWLEQAVCHTDELLHDHAMLELKAAQQAQTLIRKYSRRGPGGGLELGAEFRTELVQKLSRLAREELRHFEKVAALLAGRGEALRAVTPARYAAGLHALARSDEPAALVDALLIGAVIEARSCERFFSLVPMLADADRPLAAFYTTLLRSEARHFEDYLALARKAAGTKISARLDRLLRRDAELILAPDTQLRFHSGIPSAEPTAV